MPDLIPVRRALLSVSDKTGLANFAAALHKEFNIQLISTGGTATFLRQQNLPVTDVADVTGFPEMMDGRIKTLHPKIHGGLLALRDNPSHISSMQQHGIQPIDLLCINLYPFAQTIEKPDVTLENAIENIDIGGPAMIRSAAKNHGYVLVVTSPSRYEKILGDLRKHNGSSCAKIRLKQAQSAFAHTAEYDGLIAKYLAKQITPEVDPERQDQPAGGPAHAMKEPFAGRIGTDMLDEPAEQAAAYTSGNRSRLVQRLIDGSHDTLSAFLNNLLATMAVTVRGTEAAAFLVDRKDQDVSLKSLAHIRQDESDAATRAAAIKTFVDIVKPCVLQEKDGAIDLGNASSAPGQTEPQYCLISLLSDRAGNVEAVTAIITRCANLERARQRLLLVQLIAGYYTLSSPSAKTIAAPAPTEFTFPEQIKLSLAKSQNLRYGENPHQKAALYTDRQPAEASVAYARQLHGKELSYINLLDADGALSAVKEFSTPAACIVKHTTPCGCATASDLPTAFKNAFEGDPLAAFGGIVALNKPVDLPTARAITSIDKLLEVIVAPSYTDDALALLKERWKNVRLLEVGPMTQPDSAELMMHKIVGGYLIQQRDLTGLNESDWKIVSKRPPTEKELTDLKFAWLVCKHVKSNAIVIAKDQMLLGAGAGQMDRPSAARLAITKAAQRIPHSVAASDAFFPFPDAPELLLNAGVTAIIHPGGSLKDQETINLVNQKNAALILTGQRHFKH